MGKKGMGPRPAVVFLPEVGHSTHWNQEVIAIGSGVPGSTWVRLSQKSLKYKINKNLLRLLADGRKEKIEAQIEVA